MHNFLNLCIFCGKKLRKGDSIIKVSKFQLCHANCYRENRENTYDGIGNLEQGFLSKPRSNLNAFKDLVNSESTSDSKSFYGIWSNQLSNIIHFDFIIGIAELSGSLGFLQKIRLKRMLEKYRKTLNEVGTSYLEDYGNIKIKRQMRELYPSSGEPTIEQLKEGEKEALEIIKSQITELCSSIEAFYGDLRKLSDKTVQKEKEKIRHQIREIPKLVKILDC